MQLKVCRTIVLPKVDTWTPEGADAIMTTHWAYDAVQSRGQGGKLDTLDTSKKSQYG